MKLFVGVKAVIVHEGKVLIVKEAAYDEGLNEGKWDIPGGRINTDEPVLVGLAREVKEESGLEINPLHVLGVSETFPTIKGEACHIVRIYYLAEVSTTEVFLSKDHAEFAWVDIENPGSRDFIAPDILEMFSKVAH